ncbi:UDP-N-acetylglucosamine 1-carboxyvinyltransferase [Halanaerobium congolense]|uniref:UDP-N-acetylglucosamine 1-carboxyvinyltransferase n=1 Tax=Halanaerobium congolense TaxID=54121 RepID=A0A1G6J3F6_9FIRM|nr:UDP-N-acetylglucosamine 1-carboxyvinyltransferase [Halanaerobium congolense]PUU93295.1 MAG: UDP-N-acetylglucosamine 1-carboxyvinyltransferase [Halanaerobium sp.]PXV70054.1 UDP-N-acetylglucosamine 1-carboxyvinyltransferase [Halanaerobium congolense]SDC13177.1 UDP-N-acetylglucosamine 1-carboxyvinyltransferase [Halanaerobium congolense]SDI43387.1 UDP-N-acetylglucosamine 1-carboxyvinyltransferase [Halanaerobium congolense]SDK57677.1 UDP-N-acetylglucosamine 1-carboxyvinyltransferase [Halanaerobi
MDKYIIQGLNPLKGEIKVGGSKNAALPIIAASLLADSEVVLEDIPRLRDVTNLCSIIEDMGAKVIRDKNRIEIDPRLVSKTEADHELARKLRASYYILGVMLAKSGHARTTLPGGCNIGNRPIDLHLKGFRALGAEVNLDHGVVDVKADHLTGAEIYLDYPSVGATINIMIAASRAEGKTIIENAAREPEIVDLANFLTVMGANIKGVGTDIIKIEGVNEMHGVEHRIIPDRIEAGTYMIASAITGGDVYIRNVLTEHVKPLIAKMHEMGIIVEEDIAGVKVKADGKLKAVDVKTLPYPGFPTDMQSQMMALLTQADETSLIIETVWENRFMHVDELKRMGADIKIDGHSALVKPGCLTGAEVRATDLRAGAALILAGLAAEGQTEVKDIYHVERGYENIEERLKEVGASINKVSE